MSLTDEQIEQGQRYLSVWRHVTSRPMASHVVEFARAIEAPLLKRIAQLEAARFAYASEFCLNEEGQPDKGSIHQNIRALKAKCAELERELEAAKTVPMKYRRMEFNAQLQQENESLRTQLEAVRKDAERYRWLRTLDENFWETNRMNNMSGYHSELLDSAIDAAMEKP